MKMKTFGRYLWYRLENSALRTVVFTLLSVILTQNVVSDCIDAQAIKYNETGIFMLAVVLGVICTVIPMLENMGFKNRRNLDTLYFFPIKREKMALVHYLSGLIQILFIYTVTFFVAYAYLGINTDYFELYHMVPYYFLSLLLGLVMYSIFMFIFAQGNTIIDGVVFSLMWAFAIALVMWALTETVVTELVVTELSSRDNYQTLVMIRQFPNWGIAYAPINNLTVIYQNLIEVNMESRYNLEAALRYRDQWYMFFAWGALGVASAIGYFVTFVRKGAHKAGEISDSWFGYRLLIPIYGYSLLALIGEIELVTLLIFAAMIIGYIIYRRSFKIKGRDLVITALGIIPLLLGMVM